MIVGLLATLALAGEVGRDLPGEVMPDRHWDFVHLDLDVRIDPTAGTVEGTATHTVRPLGRPHDRVRLHQVALDVREVRVDGEPVEGWRLGETTLDVPVPPDGRERTVSVTYRARPQTGMHFRGGRGTSDPIREVWTQGEGEENRHWFPTWDYPNDKFTVETDVEVPSGLVAFANGELVGQEPAGAGWTRFRYRLDRPIVSYLVAIVAGEYATYVDESEIPLTYIVPRTVGEEAARRSLGVTAEQVPWFSELLGHPFPYGSYRQAFVSRFLYGGMENATLTVLSDRLLLAHPSARDRSTEEVVAHELAHQWFGDLLTCYGWRELWLNEGFASFYTGRWLEHRYGADRYAAEQRGWMTAALHDPAPMSPRAWSKVPGRDNAAVYVRGASVLHMLRTHLGTDVFDAGIREYVARNADRLVETDDLRRALEDVSGQHLGWLFEQWVHGTGHPVVETTWSWRDGTLDVLLAQKTEGAPFSAPVQIEIGADDGVRVHRMWLGAGEAKLSVPLDASPLWVAVDAPGGVLAEWRHEQPAEAWAAQARRSPTPYARIIALEQLGETKAGAVAVEALSAVLRDEATAPELRAAAARSLGELGTPEALAVLVAELPNGPPDVREAVAEGLGEAPIDHADAASALARAASADPDAYVRARALGSLAAVAPQRGLDLARQRLRRPDSTPARSEHVAALRLMSEHGSSSDLSTVLRRVSQGEHRDARHTAARAAASIVDREGAAGAPLAQRLIPLLEDPDVRDRQLAVALLAKVGNDRAVTALRAMARTTTVVQPDLASAALDAAQAIRAREANPGAEVAPGEDLQRLVERLEELEERLQRLETWR